MNPSASATGNTVITNDYHAKKSTTTVKAERNVT